MPRPRAPPAHHYGLPLRTLTDARWIHLALRRFDDVLVDHAHCEKKAAAQALSLLQAYPELPSLPVQMAQLAREESGHLARVLRLMEERGLSLGADPGDPYVQKLRSLVRSPRALQRLDRLLVCAIVEARSSERLSLLAQALDDRDLQRLYGELAQSERGHQSLFFRLAVSSAGLPSASARLNTLLDREAEVVVEVGIRPAIH
jgi:tRNA 2-(methylsulfanyl)-N6-isopentenyladenosine37 hydroxylase